MATTSWSFASTTKEEYLEHILALVIWFLNVLEDGTTPNFRKPLRLTNPPQCSGVPISWSASKTLTEIDDFETISRAVNNPERLPPATITSYLVLFIASYWK